MPFPFEPLRRWASLGGRRSGIRAGTRIARPSSAPSSDPHHSLASTGAVVHLKAPPAHGTDETLACVDSDDHFERVAALHRLIATQHDVAKCSRRRKTPTKPCPKRYSDVRAQTTHHGEAEVLNCLSLRTEEAFQMLRARKESAGAEARGRMGRHRPKIPNFSWVFRKSAADDGAVHRPIEEPSRTGSDTHVQEEALARAEIPISRRRYHIEQDGKFVYEDNGEGTNNCIMTVSPAYQVRSVRPSATNDELTVSLAPAAAQVKKPWASQASWWSTSSDEGDDVPPPRSRGSLDVDVESWPEDPEYYDSTRRPEWGRTSSGTDPEEAEPDSVTPVGKATALGTVYRPQQLTLHHGHLVVEALIEPLDAAQAGGDPYTVPLPLCPTDCLPDSPTYSPPVPTPLEHSPSPHDGQSSEGESSDFDGGEAPTPDSGDTSTDTTATPARHLSVARRMLFATEPAFGRGVDHANAGGGTSGADRMSALGARRNKLWGPQKVPSSSDGRKDPQIPGRRTWVRPKASPLAFVQCLENESAEDEAA